MTYEIEIDLPLVHFTAADAPERSTGWKDQHSYDPEDGSLQFFDAEANDLFDVSPIGDLRDAISDWNEERDAELEREAEAAQDPYAVHGVRRSDFR